MYVTDLATYQYKIPFAFEGVRCVGWLDREHKYDRGETPSGFVRRLTQLVVHRTSTFDLHVNVVRGIHPCNICGEEVEVALKGYHKTQLGMSELWIPHLPGLLSAPSLIVHYVASHGYLPPACFVTAVLALRTESRFLGQAEFDTLMRYHCRSRSETESERGEKGHL
jgi:hypothetical protein